MSKLNRDALERTALKAGYELSEASSATRMRSLNETGRKARWEINPVDNRWADCVGYAYTLSEVSQRLDEIEVMKAYR